MLNHVKDFEFTRGKDQRIGRCSHGQHEGTTCPHRQGDGNSLKGDALC